MKTAPFGVCGVLLLPCFSILAIAKPDQAPRSARTWEAPPVLAMMFHGPGYTDPEYGWSLVPSFVLYADGRVIVAVRRFSRDGMSLAIWEGRLDSAGVCTLLDQIAADGFLALKNGDYVKPGITDLGTTTITINAWQSNTISAYGFEELLKHPGYKRPFAKIPAALMATARRLTDYRPPGAQPYQPDRLSIRLSSRDSEVAAPPWPLSEPTLTELATKGTTHGRTMIEGRAARDVYRQVNRQVTNGFIERYSENGKTYRVTIRPLLPYEEERYVQNWSTFSFVTKPATTLTCSSDVG
jgi:hypothetical protein